MRDRLIFFIFFTSTLICLPAASLRAQVSAGELKLLHKLDSISASASVSAYFADLYFVTMVNSIRFFEDADDSSRLSIRRMQAGFAEYFFAAADSFKQQKKIPPEWQRFYADTSHTDLRHILMGINAHMNGDLWPVLAQSFSYKELKQICPLYFSYYHGLLDIYEDVYEAAYKKSPPLRFVHAISLGLDKWYGKKLLRRWLKRQMNIACLFYRDKKRFQRKVRKLNRRVKRMDEAIGRHF